MDGLLFKEILCSKCGKIPRILNVHTDNGKIELKCKKCGIYEISIDNYYKELYQNNYFKKCSSNKCESKEINNKYYYCLDCKGDYCEKCQKEYHSGHQFIDSDEKKEVCLKHNQKFKYYCFDDEENFCDKEKELEHKGHDIIEISEFEKSIFNYHKDNKLGEINEELEKLVKFNDLILKKIEILKDNELYLKSVKNIGKSLKEGNERDSQDTKCLLYDLSKYMENSIDANLKLRQRKQIDLPRNNKYLHLNGGNQNQNQKLDDKDFEYISQIRFNQLKEIDISENKIKNVQPFNKMSLPFLEFLNLSYNNIEIIEPVTKINSKNLEYIFLQKNKIKDIGAFLDSNFQNIKIIRVEDNINLESNNEEENKNLKKVLEEIDTKYPNRFIYKPFEEQKNDFKKKYSFDIWDKDVIDLSDVKGGDEMLKKLVLIITYAPRNRIKKLILRNNKITDPSILSKANFDLLEELDLSLNYIKDLKFLLDMKAKNLIYLFLDNNIFTDFSPLFRKNSKNLKCLTLNENNSDSEDKTKTTVYDELKKIYGNLEIQFGPFKKHFNNILENKNSENKNQ